MLKKIGLNILLYISKMAIKAKQSNGNANIYMKVVGYWMKF